ncbi:VTT domain-containing protein [Methanolobus sp. ZRKC4]|uniref:VTT domain-containing protein n=1 Tax=Methanolobus sp. ZRKC4 TaxID=3125787 RepID=UPI0032554410
MKTKKILFFLWLPVVIAGISTFLFFPERISLSFLKQISESYHFAAILIYFLILSFRGLTFIPSTPLLLAGILIFEPGELFVTNMAGILASSSIVYYFSSYLGFDTYFETKYSKQAKKLREKLTDKELPIIIGWGFFPLVPTDLIVYISSTLKINVLKCLLGIFIGEAILNGIYIYSARMILNI